MKLSRWIAISFVLAAGCKHEDKSPATAGSAGSAAATAPAPAAPTTPPAASGSAAAPAAGGTLSCPKWDEDMKKLESCGKVPKQLMDQYKDARTNTEKALAAQNLPADKLAEACAGLTLGLEQSGKTFCGW